MRKLPARTLLMGLSLSMFAVSAHAQTGPGGGGGPPGGGGGPPGRGGPPGGAPKAMKPIKREAIDKPVTAMFRAADTNRDGLVTPEELRAIVEARREKRIRERFARIDADRNGSISAEEFIGWQRGLGSVASSEQQDLAGPVSETLGPDLDDDAKDRALDRLIEPLSALTIVNANTNYDTGVSLEELLIYQRRRFDAADADRDGELKMEELRGLDPKRERGWGGPGGPGGPPRPPGD